MSGYDPSRVFQSRCDRRWAADLRDLAHYDKMHGFHTVGGENQESNQRSNQTYHLGKSPGSSKGGWFRRGEARGRETSQEASETGNRSGNEDLDWEELCGQGEVRMTQETVLGLSHAEGVMQSSGGSEGSKMTHEES